MTSLSAVVTATGFEHFMLSLVLAVSAAASTLIRFLKSQDQAFETIK